MKCNNKTENYTDFFYYFFRNILLVSIPLVIISVIVLSSIHISATGSGADQILFSLSVSCTLSSVVDSAHTKEITNGTYHSDVGKTTITTLCNDGNGYSVYANGYSNNEEGNNKLINTEYPQYSIDTGLDTSGLTSTWAMKLNNIENDPSPTPPTIESDYNDTYGLVPSYWTKVASRASGTTDMAQGSSFTTTYAVYASSSQYAGTYQGRVKYLLTHPAYPPAFHYMQDVAKWQNEILNPGDTLLATDARDNKEYWVTRLADGHIWMTQNLDFDIDTNTTLNSRTTDLNVLYDASTNSYREYQDGYTSNGNTIYWKPVNTATTIDFQNTGPITGWANNAFAPYSASKIDDANTGHTSLGNWYNWTMAIASNNSSNITSNEEKNSICPKGWRLPMASNSDQTVYEFGDLLYKYDIIPTRTATNFANNGFQKISLPPLWFTKSGYVSGSSLMYLTEQGYYWASTSVYRNAAHYLGYYSGGISLAGQNNNNALGFQIRCIAR